MLAVCSCDVCTCVYISPSGATQLQSPVLSFPFFLFCHPLLFPSYLTLSPPSHSSFATRIPSSHPPFLLPLLSLLFCSLPSSAPLSDTPMDYKIKSALVCDTLSLAGVPLQDPYTAVRAASASYTRAAAAKHSGPSVKLVSEQLQAGAAEWLIVFLLCLRVVCSCGWLCTVRVYVFMYPCAVFIHTYSSKTIMELTSSHITHVSLFKCMCMCLSFSNQALTSRLSCMFLHKPFLPFYHCVVRYILSLLCTASPPILPPPAFKGEASAQGTGGD